MKTCTICGNPVYIHSKEEWTYLCWKHFFSLYLNKSKPSLKVHIHVTEGYGLSYSSWSSKTHLSTLLIARFTLDTWRLERFGYNDHPANPHLLEPMRKPTDTFATEIELAAYIRRIAHLNRWRPIEDEETYRQLTADWTKFYLDNEEVDSPRNPQ